MLEFSIAAPLILIFLVSVYDIGQLVVQRGTLTRVLREVSRVAANTQLQDMQCSFDGASSDVYPPTLPAQPCPTESGHPAILQATWNLAELNLGRTLNMYRMSIISSHDSVAHTTRIQTSYQYSGIMWPFQSMTIVLEATAAMPNG